jgi:hypothetical protein
MATIWFGSDILASPVQMMQHSSDLAKSLASCGRQILSPKNWLRPQIGRAQWGFNQTYPKNIMIMEQKGFFGDRKPGTISTKTKVLF